MPLTNINATLAIATDISVAPEVHNADLNATAFAALTWTDIKAVGNFGETGSSVNILTYDTWDTLVTQKGPGITNAGDPEIEVAFDDTDPGQTALRTAASAANRQNNYAIRKTLADGTSVRYYRGLVLGPRHPNGGPEDFEVEIFTLALNQEEVAVYA